MEDLKHSVDAIRQIMAVWALASAIASYEIARIHLKIKRSWYASRYFWLGLLGNIPALIGFAAHVHFSLMTGRKEPGMEEPLKAE
jgi:hypothetical protein